jgi:predicted ABC-type ATPase
MATGFSFPSLLRKTTDSLETTLAAKSYLSLITKAKTFNYEITLIFFWLSSPELAKSRVIERVEEGGHNIPSEVIERRYYRGIHNLINLYIPVCDNWIIIDNGGTQENNIAQGSMRGEMQVINSDIWKTILEQSKL